MRKRLEDNENDDINMRDSVIVNNYIRNMLDVIGKINVMVNSYCGRLEKEILRTGRPIVRARKLVPQQLTQQLLAFLPCWDMVSS